MTPLLWGCRAKAVAGPTLKRHSRKTSWLLADVVDTNTAPGRPFTVQPSRTSCPCPRERVVEELTSSRLRSVTWVTAFRAMAGAAPPSMITRPRCAEMITL
ncbi:MAG: hypothetical protein ACI9EF_001513 [Pseudohongiellaceae bacterium]|jgi:hypothetical protein